MFRLIHFYLNLLEKPDSSVLNIERNINITNKASRYMYVFQRHMPSLDEWTKEKVIESSKELEEKLSNKWNVIPAHIVTIYDHLLQDIDEEKLLTFGGNDYLLIELPKGHIPGYTAKTIYDLQVKGYQPILLYPEQNKLIQNDPSILYQMVKKGLVVLINGESILGQAGKKAQQFAKQMLQHNLAHLVNVDNDLAPEVNKVLDKIKKEHGAEVERLLMENASCMETGYPIIMNEPSRIKKKGIFSLR